MGLFDGKTKQENEMLKARVMQLEALLTPEMQDITRKQEYIANLDRQIADKNNYINDQANMINRNIQELNRIQGQINFKKQYLVEMDDEIIYQEFGLYKPTFLFATALDYKEKLAEIRNIQKSMIKNGQAVTGDMNWLVNGSAAKGKKMVSDTQKLLMKAFNSECDEIVSKVKYTNYDASLDRIYKSAGAISKLGAGMKISITQQYVGTKIQEVRLAFEYAQKKQQEKEDAKEAREALREAAKVQKELEAKRALLDKEQTHYTTAYDKLMEQLKLDPENRDLLSKKEELEKRLADIDQAYKEVDYREANQKAGYVYVISNIGAFGENIYKIGMTRRLEPQDRVDELGNAAVPFNFDVHAMIFSDDAPALEAALHRAFEDRKVNMVNHRREFFNVTLDEIKEVIRNNYDKTVEFIDVADAEQYRVSKKMKEELKGHMAGQSQQPVNNHYVSQSV